MKTFFGGIFVNQQQLEEEGINYPIKVEYYKTAEEEKGEKIYGIEVIKKEYKIIEEKVQIDRITKEENEIENLLKLLRRNEVTTIGVRDVVEDMY